MIGASTRLLAVLGHPIGHSLSPAMHNAALQALGLDAVYLAFDVTPAGLPQAIAGLQALGSPGWNLTAPLKTQAAELAGRLAPPAADLGAVNTMVWDGRELVGHNTDVEGIERALVGAGTRPDGRPGLVLGAGGAARAAAWALARLGLAVVIAARSGAGELAATVGAAHPGWAVRAAAWADRDQVAAEAGVVINATPLGHNGASMPTSPTVLGPGQTGCDLVYARGLTPWLRAVAANRARVVDGREVLLEQGVAAFRLFTGLTPPAAVMRRALLGGNAVC